MKGFVCGTCGHIAFDSAPENCPVCKSPKSVFAEKDAIKTAQDEGSGEKHVPVIKVVKQCGLIGEGCTDVHVKVGEVTHPMEAEHFITWIDFYVDKKWVERVMLTPDLNPAAGAHIKADSGKLTVIELCNLHGHWINEVDL
jgi:superoxide reductase